MLPITKTENITSLELLKQINLFRSKEENKSKLGHNDLLKVIRDEFEEEISLGKISHTPYIHPQNGQTYPMFNLTISQAKQVLVRESKFVRKAIISYLEELESKKNSIDFSNPDNVLMLVQNWKQERDEKEKLQKQLKQNEVKINFIDRVIASDDMIDIGQCAKVLELPFGRNTLFKELREKGIFFKTKNEPKQALIERGYFKLKETFIETNNHGTKAIIKVLVTQRGLGYLSTLFESKPSSKKQIALV